MSSDPQKEDIPPPRDRRPGLVGPTPELTGKIAAEIRLGGTPSTAAGIQGVPLGQFKRWMAQGQEEGADPALRAFRDEVMRAETACVLRLYRVVREAARRDPHLARELAALRKTSAERGLGNLLSLTTEQLDRMQKDL